ncbi:pilus assembly PilX N-terminal domain-containing protein [Shewanella yunxiaonensis]|uniref:Pilus assembly PilX N-terminal domain-containing protein n=1 Tax=Shewanella yunxiaonensis TaxID=2829809 RepID=A0ABX7YQL6_9GAMM|nr:PilX N-terminal domain-containing pilus assembly protein [Shewanella yunxiaonensis]QUN04912.1 pilus assembly PilX N-terminal domain-containing protein [Shewanella yunxiaonensis]
MKGLKRQSGVVLFFALILLIVMTVIGVALAVNSGQSLRMAGAGSERIEAKAIADGGLAAVINANAGSSFATMNSQTTVTAFNGNQTITPLPKDDPKDVGCQRTVNATSANLISCRRIEVTNTVAYGRDDMGSLTVTTGVEQQVLTGN